jgi:hypothetical protein
MRRAKLLRRFINNQPAVSDARLAEWTLVEPSSAAPCCVCLISFPVSSLLFSFFEYTVIVSTKIPSVDKNVVKICFCQTARVI